MIFLVDFIISRLKGDAPRQTWIYYTDIAGGGRHVKCPKRHLIPNEQALGTSLPLHSTPLYFCSFSERIVFHKAGYSSCGYNYQQQSPEWLRKYQMFPKNCSVSIRIIKVFKFWKLVFGSSWIILLLAPNLTWNCRTGFHEVSCICLAKWIDSVSQCQIRSKHARSGQLTNVYWLVYLELSLLQSNDLVIKNRGVWSISRTTTITLVYMVCYRQCLQPVSSHDPVLNPPLYCINLILKSCIVP